MIFWPAAFGVTLPETLMTSSLATAVEELIEAFTLYVAAARGATSAPAERVAATDSGIAATTSAASVVVSFMRLPPCVSFDAASWAPRT